MTANAPKGTNPSRFSAGSEVRVVRSCVPGDSELIGKRGKVVRISGSGGIVVRFGSFWRSRVATCFPEELESVAE